MGDVQQGWIAINGCSRWQRGTVEIGRESQREKLRERDGRGEMAYRPRATTETRNGGRRRKASKGKTEIAEEELGEEKNNGLWA